MTDETTTELPTPDELPAGAGAYAAMCERCGWSMTGVRAEVISAAQVHPCTPADELPADELPAEPAPGEVDGRGN